MLRISFVRILFTALPYWSLSSASLHTFLRWPANGTNTLVSTSNIVLRVENNGVPMSRQLCLRVHLKRNDEVDLLRDLSMP